MSLLLRAKQLTPDEILNTSLGYAALIVAVVVLFGVILWVKSLFQDGNETAEFDHDMLTQIGDLRRQGDLTEEEYRSIKNQLLPKGDVPPVQPPAPPLPEEKPDGKNED